MNSITVRTESRARALVDSLKRQGKQAHYEVFATYTGFYCVVYYR